ncbi:hypothetical protein [Lewinella sp. JB7]|uniref:capsular polysaccharide export protein, LipB/KpsS family n=1 Tax=Lewinella sp. JB7 TaxID=2962887 RepID=UPI0020C9A8A5|nr:hypothetical protein [Lewinella sp. JB7]MCP9236757.1 hypothetical protein [Lewinella sp. JB7]
MNILVNGFATHAVDGLVAKLAATPPVDHVYWIRDNLGERRLSSGPEITVIDHQAALVLESENMPSVRTTVEWTDALLDRYTAIKPTVLKMQDRLERYGPPVSAPTREATFRRQFLYWLGFLREYRIEAFVASNIPHEIADYVIAELCGVLGIQTLYFYQWTPDLLLPMAHYREMGQPATRPAAVLSDEDADIRSAVGNRISRQQRGEAEARPFYVQAGNIARQRRKREQHWLTRAANKLKGDWRKLIRPSALRYAWYLGIEKRWTQPRHDEAFVRRYAALADSTPDLERPYVYLALHYQPEATTSPLAERFVDQYLMVDVLLAAFPPEVHVYVKEHPAQRLIGRGARYYELFGKSARVRFIATEVSSSTLQQRAVAVATASGTVGFESMWKGIPVLAFGYTYYEGGPGVYTVRSVADARRAAKRIMEGDHPAASDPETFTQELVKRALPANGDGYYHDNSVLGLSVGHNVRVIGNEIIARLAAPASPPS